MKATGDCFEECVAFLLERRLRGDADKYTLVHGEVSGNGETEGIRHVHSWLEHGDGAMSMCLNVSNGKILMVPSHVFYLAGEIGQTVRYSARKAANMVAKFENYGPWNAVLNIVQDNAVRTLTEEIQ